MITLETNKTKKKMGNCLKKEGIKTKRRDINNEEIVNNDSVYPDNPKDVPPFPWINKFIYCKVYDVHDGDTVKVLIDYKNVLFNVSIRVQGINTPEISRCSELEKMAGIRVTEYVKEILENKVVKLYCTKWDKYGGRIDGYLFLGLDGIDNLSNHLLELKYAKPYTGKVAKEPWTNEELKFILDLAKN